MYVRITEEIIGKEWTGTLVDFHRTTFAVNFEFIMYILLPNMCTPHNMYIINSKLTV